MDQKQKYRRAFIIENSNKYKSEDDCEKCTAITIVGGIFLVIIIVVICLHL